MTAAISGAHTLGSAKVKNSGYDGFWSSAASASVFDIDYYKSILFKGWQPQLNVSGNSAKHQWERIDLGRTSDVEMMLDTDLCLVYKNNKLAETVNDSRYDLSGEPLSALNGDCCAWIGNCFIK